MGGPNTALRSVGDFGWSISNTLVLDEKRCPGLNPLGNRDDDIDGITLNISPMDADRVSTNGC